MHSQLNPFSLLYHDSRAVIAFFLSRRIQELAARRARTCLPLIGAAQPWAGIDPVLVPLVRVRVRVRAPLPPPIIPDPPPFPPSLLVTLARLTHLCVLPPRLDGRLHEQRMEPPLQHVLET